MGNWSGGSTRAWRRTRALVLAENQRTNAGRCTLALQGCTGVADTVHHTRGRGVTGDDRRWLAAVCAWCNGSVGDPTKGKDPPPRPITRW